MENTTIEASSVLGDGYVKVKWTKSAGSVDAYEIYRSTKKDSGYGDTPYFTTKQGGLSGWYKNTKELKKKGTRYYYKVRGKRRSTERRITRSGRTQRIEPIKPSERACGTRALKRGPQQKKAISG